MRQITISANVEAVCPTGPYQNQRFAFGISEAVEITDDNELRLKHEDLGNKCYDLFKTFEQRAVKERIELERKDFRWYKLSDGTEGPSVTSFLNYDADFFLSPQLLQEHASQGTLLHLMASHYFATGNWITDLKTLIYHYPRFWTDYVIVTKGTLVFDPSKWNFPAFLEKFPFKAKEWNVKVLNDQDRYGGELDVIGDYQGELTIADFKKNPDKKDFMQTACYAKAYEMNAGKKVDNMMLISCYPDTQQGFSKPLQSKEIDKFYEMAMSKREGFKKRYGV